MAPTCSIQLDALRRLLSELGLRCHTDRRAWHECLLVSDEEHFLGRGETEEAALWSAVQAAFPTRAAQALLLRWGRTQGADGASDEAPSSGGADGAAESMRGATAAPTDDRAAHATPVAPNGGDSMRGATAAPTDDRAAHATPAAPNGDARGAALEPAASAPSVVHTVPPDAPPPARPPRPSRRETNGDPEAALQDLVARIDRDAPDLACVAPARQRLVLLGWLAAARAWQDAEPRNLRVAALVPDIVRRLRSITDAWWPGTISAFLRDAWPAHCHRDIPGVDAASLPDWDAVERAASEALARAEEEDAAAGLDVDGWADAAFLHPAPDDPDELLEALVQEIEQHGSLALRQPKHLPVPPTDRLIRWAWQARWLRGAVRDGLRWGAVIGRLRFWSGGAPEVRRVLDPHHRPPRPWGALLRGAEEQAAEEAELREVLARVPPPTASDEQRLAWLRRALPLTTHHQAKIAEAAAPLRAWILALGPEAVVESDRRIRRRLRKLQESLAPGEMIRPASRTEEVEDEPASGLRVPAGVRAATRGRHALFVSNRADPALQERLADEFGFALLDWAEATPRRIEAAVEKIASGRFEMVLGATGFLSHKEDYRLATACRAAGIPYIRVNKGRPTAVATALQRELAGAAA